MADKSTTGRIAEAITTTDQGGAFISSIVAGLILGYLLDRWLGTGPWLTVGLSLVGAYSGFMRAWHYAKTQGALEDEERKQRGR
jgi:ATP synthase protein I